MPHVNRHDRLREGLAILPWVSGFVFVVLWIGASGARPALLARAQLLWWLFMLGVLLPTGAHIWIVGRHAASARPGPYLPALRWALYACCLIGVLGTATLLNIPGPDPAHFSDLTLIYLGRPLVLSAVVAVITGMSLTLFLRIPPFVSLWAAMNEKQVRNLSWLAGVVSIAFAVVTFGLVSYYAAGWTWLAGSTQ